LLSTATYTFCAGRRSAKELKPLMSPPCEIVRAPYSLPLLTAASHGFSVATPK
jgi:hypothetical protein